MADKDAGPASYTARVRARKADLGRLEGKARRLVKVLWAARSGITHQLPIDQQRANLRALFDGMPDSDVPIDTTDIDIALPQRSLCARVHGQPSQGRRAPVLLYLHGGGWTLGDLWLADRQCAELALACQATVINLRYRLAPEHRFPAAYHDVIDSVDWLLGGGGDLGAAPDNLVLIGDSSGGNLAATAAQARRDQIAAQVLIYPQAVTTGRAELLDHRYDDFFVSVDGLASFEQHYLGEHANPDDPRFAPLLGGDLSGLPPALLVLAQCDPLRPQGEAYAEALRRHGVSVQLVTMPGMIHGFFGLSAILPAAAEAVRAIAVFLEHHLRIAPGGSASRSKTSMLLEG